MIPIIRPVLGEAEIQAAAGPLRSGWVTQGPETAAFEAEFAALVGARHACAVSSCTTALHLALLAAGVGPGDEVITASHTFIATANAIRYCGAEPVFIDVEPGGFNLDPELIGATVSPRTKALVAVHQAGMPCDLSRVVAAAEKAGLVLIEDAACAVGSRIRWQGEWQRIGRPHGRAACFSFHPRKLLTTGDGGMITTNDPDWDRRFRLWRQHGMTVPDTARHAAREVIFEEYPDLGFNYRLTDIQAAVGRAQLKRLEEILGRRRELAARYFNLLAEIPGLGLPLEPEWARSNWQSFLVKLPEGADQKTVMQYLLDHGVASRRGIMNCHQERPYLGARGGDRLPNSEAARDKWIILPLFHQMTEAEQNRVAEVLGRACSMGLGGGR